MYLGGSTANYNAKGEQTSSGLFLILLDCFTPGTPCLNSNGHHNDFTRTDLRAVVRHVRLRQMGHFMMGTTRIGSRESTILSGAYGGDGLPKHVPHYLWEKGVPLPPELVEAWSKGGGHNSVGSEHVAMKAWAWDNLAILATRAEWRFICQKVVSAGEEKDLSWHIQRGLPTTKKTWCSREFRSIEQWPYAPRSPGYGRCPECYAAIAAARGDSK